jgi:hypothetical protein
MEWISVKDRLPTQMGDYPVLICRTRNNVLQATWYNDGITHGFYIGDYAFYERDTINYWMPLPEPPNQ